MATFLLPFIRSKNKLKFFCLDTTFQLTFWHWQRKTFRQRQKYNTLLLWRKTLPHRDHVKRFRARKRNSTKSLDESKKQHKTSIFDSKQHTTARWWIWGKNIWSITGKARTTNPPVLWEYFPFVQRKMPDLEVRLAFTLCLNFVKGQYKIKENYFHFYYLAEKQ